jgi:integrase
MAVPKRAGVLKYIPDDNEIKAFFSAINRVYKKEKDRLIYNTTFSLYAKTGLRLYELIDLKYMDVDFEKKKISG